MRKPVTEPPRTSMSVAKATAPRLGTRLREYIAARSQCQRSNCRRTRRRCMIRAYTRYTSKTSTTYRARRRPCMHVWHVTNQGCTSYDGLPWSFQERYRTCNEFEALMGTRKSYFAIKAILKIRQRLLDKDSAKGDSKSSSEGFNRSCNPLRGNQKSQGDPAHFRRRKLLIRAPGESHILYAVHPVWRPIPDRNTRVTPTFLN